MNKTSLINVSYPFEDNDPYTILYCRTGKLSDYSVKGSSPVWYNLVTKKFRLHNGKEFICNNFVNAKDFEKEMVIRNNKIESKYREQLRRKKLQCEQQN